MICTSSAGKSSKPTAMAAIAGCRARCVQIGADRRESALSTTAPMRVLSRCTDGRLFGGRRESLAILLFYPCPRARRERVAPSGDARGVTIIAFQNDRRHSLRRRRRSSDAGPRSVGVGSDPGPRGIRAASRPPHG